MRRPGLGRMIGSQASPNWVRQPATAVVLLLVVLLAAPQALSTYWIIVLTAVAIYSVVAANSPVGRTSTTQGLFGAAGTVGFIVASLIAGVLAARDITYPFYVFSAFLATTLVVGLVVGRGRLSGRSPRIV